jgi:hypothetical protein
MLGWLNSGKPLAEQGGNLLAWLHALLLPTRRRTSSPPLQQAGVDTPPACAPATPAQAETPTPEPPHESPDLQTRLSRRLRFPFFFLNPAVNQERISAIHKT